jgi:hypothetical protein
VLGIWKRPSLVSAPVASAINDASKITRWTTFRKLDDAHCDLVAHPAVDDCRDGSVADLGHSIGELNLTSAVAIYGVTAKSALNGSNTSLVTCSQLREMMFGRRVSGQSESWPRVGE